MPPPDCPLIQAQTLTQQDLQTISTPKIDAIRQNAESPIPSLDCVDAALDKGFSPLARLLIEKEPGLIDSKIEMRRFAR